MRRDTYYLAGLPDTDIDPLGDCNPLEYDLPEGYEPPREGKCQSCGSPSANDQWCIRCERNGR